MKNINIWYWITTALFGGFMLFSAIPDALCTDDAVKFMTSIGYPVYIISFLGIMKILGVIGILVPGFPRLKEWAYAGLMFDLLGAAYSVMRALGGMGWTFMLVVMAVGFISYLMHHRRLQAHAAAAA